MSKREVTGRHKLAKCRKPGCYPCLFWELKQIVEYTIAAQYIEWNQKGAK